jgi:hypothetical protein
MMSATTRGCDTVIAWEEWGNSQDVGLMGEPFAIAPLRLTRQLVLTQVQASLY